MAFLLITESIERTIEMLEADAIVNEKAFIATADKKYSELANSYRNKLGAAIKYKRFDDCRSDYQKIKHLRTRNPVQYAIKCKDIVKDIKGVSFDTDRFLFRLQVVTGNGKKVTGRFDTPEDAMDILKMYI